MPKNCIEDIGFSQENCATEDAKQIDPIYHCVVHNTEYRVAARENKSISEFNRMREKCVEKCWDCPKFATEYRGCRSCMKRYLAQKNKAKK